MGAYSKAIVGALTAFLTAIVTALTPDPSGSTSITAAEWIIAALAALGALGAVWGVSNTPVEKKPVSEKEQF